ncbi:MAG: hypothetical protein PQJ60_10705 [Spirochaetales bacterium]|nr:hypothetical protein [Spirochaetales bacterium]
MSQTLDKFEVGAYFTSDFLKSSGMIQAGSSIGKLYDFVLDYDKAAGDSDVAAWPSSSGYVDASPVYEVRAKGIKYGAPNLNGGKIPVFRAATDNGLPTGSDNMVGDFSGEEGEFYVEALAGERLSIRRAILHIYVSANDIEPGTYGNLTLTTGISLFWERSGITYDVLAGDTILKQEDWGRLCYDAIPVGPYGSNSKTPMFQVRLSFDKFVDSEFGIILEEGDRLGVKLNDNFPESTIDEHHLMYQGSHLGNPSGDWLVTF